MKWKVVFGLLATVIIGGTSLVSVILYYHFDWAVLADLSFYENLANPAMRIVRVEEGLRKEQVADVVGSKLGWSAGEKDQFINTQLAVGDSTGESSLEGYYFPKTYMMAFYDDPLTVSKIMLHAFQTQTSSIVKTKSTKVINQDTAVKIASIIQREAGGKKDMRLISGIIWNRLFKGMKLQMDATVQYAKGSSEDGWWPKVNPSDISSIDSPYNTYKYPSLPPTPIASPGLDAIAAAYNPQSTNCIFYIHDKNHQIHCASTYAQHLKNIVRYY